MSMLYETVYDPGNDPRPRQPRYRLGVPRRYPYPVFDVLPQPAQPGPSQIVGAPPMPDVQPKPAPAPAPAAGDTILGFPRNYVLIGGAAILGYFLLGKRR